MLLGVCSNKEENDETNDGMKPNPVTCKVWCIYLLNDDDVLNVVPTGIDHVHTEPIQRPPFTRTCLYVLLDGKFELLELVIRRVNWKFQENMKLCLGRSGPIDNPAVGQRSVG